MHSQSFYVVEVDALTGGVDVDRAKDEVKVPKQDNEVGYQHGDQKDVYNILERVSKQEISSKVHKTRRRLKRKVSY